MPSKLLWHSRCADSGESDVFTAYDVFLRHADGDGANSSPRPSVTPEAGVWYDAPSTWLSLSSEGSGFDG